MQTTQQRINANSSVINIDKLRNEVSAREDRKFKTFEHILDMCYQKIINTNKTSNDCCCNFVCPNLVFGLPLFNLNECIMFIMQKLNEKGFNVHLAIPNKLFISWKDPQQEQPKYPQLTYTPTPQHAITYPMNNNNMQQLPSNNTYTQSLDKNITDFGLYSFPKSENKSEHKTIKPIKNNMHQQQWNTSTTTRNKIELPKKNYRPIDDYKQSSNTIYDSSDIDVFRNKIDELFT